MKADLEYLISDSNKLSQCFEKYNELTKKESCDKHRIGFNIDGRFNAAGEHSVSFDSYYGYYGNSDCYDFLSLNTINKDLFWDYFDKYINSHKEEIIDYISKGFKREIYENKNEIEKEMDRLSSLLEKIEQTNE